MNINVPREAEDHFWDEPPAGAEEFWSFRFPPPCTPGDPLIFRMRGVVVARAICHRIERPGQSACDATGRFAHGHKVFWRPDTFAEDHAGRSLIAARGD